MKPLRILLVEEEANLRQGLSLELNRQGHDVEIATTCDQALAALQLGDGNLDVMILDTEMECLATSGFLDRVEAFGGVAPVIALTSFINGSVIRDRLSHWRARFLEKPFSFEELLTILINLVES